MNLPRSHCGPGSLHAFSHSIQRPVWIPGAGDYPFHLTDVKTKALRIYRARAPTQALRYYSLVSFYNIRGFQIFSFLFKKYPPPFFFFLKENLLDASQCKTDFKKRRSCSGTQWGRKARAPATQHLPVPWGTSMERQGNQCENRLTQTSVPLPLASLLASQAPGEELFSGLSQGAQGPLHIHVDSTA